MIAIDNGGVTNPYFNLALEEYLVRNADCSKEEYLLLYVNEPCIVLGKNQSIYREVNFDCLRKEKLKLARRVSGGGTVYHDEGNLNFAFISSFNNSKVNNYHYFNSRLVEALNTVGVEAKMDARNNIICNGKKLSGGAQFTNRRNIISHGTLLYNANLEALRHSLIENPFPVQTKAVASVKSSVANIVNFSSSITSVAELKRLILDAYSVSQTRQLTEREWQDVKCLAAEKYASYAWVYGRSPLTTIQRERIVITVEDGVVTETNSSLIPPHITAHLAGVSYSHAHIKKALGQILNASHYLTEIF